jgi:uncharacterized protein (TIGR02996 family)
MEALWRAANEHPDDDEARRVLADALLERGDVRGELIAIQLELARHPEDERGPREQKLADRERALLDAHADSWLAGWPFELRPWFVRGFPQRQHSTAADFVLHGERALQLAPTLRELVLTDENPRRRDVVALAASGAAQRLTHLTLPVTMTPRDMPAVATLPLRSLSFNGGFLGDLGVTYLAQMPLQHLAFEFDVGLREGFEVLDRLPLKSFISRGNPLVLRPWPDLERLTLDRVEAVVQPLRWPKLERLELFDLRLGRRGLRELLAQGHPHVRRLGVHQERLEASDVALLERWPSLEVLDLTETQVSRDVLENSPVVRRLRCRLGFG